MTTEAVQRLYSVERHGLSPKQIKGVQQVAIVIMPGKEVVLNGHHNGSNTTLDILTEKQREIAMLVTAGRTNKQIADEQRMGKNTVRNHVQRICKRLEVENRTQIAVAIATSSKTPTIEGDLNASPLTPQEKEIIDLITQGKLNKQIAAKLKVSERTVKNRIGRILEKLDAENRTQAAVKHVLGGGKSKTANCKI